MSNVLIAMALQNNYCSTEENKEKMKGSCHDESGLENQSVVSSRGNFKTQDEKTSKIQIKCDEA